MKCLVRVFLLGKFSWILWVKKSSVLNWFFNTEYRNESLCCHIFNLTLLKQITNSLIGEIKGGLDSECQGVNRLPPLEYSAAFSGSHLRFISDDLCCTNKNGSGHWFQSRGGRFSPALVLIDGLVGGRDNIVADLCVSRRKWRKVRKKKKKQSPCHAGATGFLLTAPGLPGPSLILKFLSPSPAACVPLGQLIYRASLLQ